MRGKKKVNNKHNSKHLYNNKSSIMAEMGLLILLSNKKRFNIVVIKRFGTNSYSFKLSVIILIDKYMFCVNYTLVRTY